MEGAIYSQRLSKHGIAYITPPAPRREVIDGIIFDELLNGIASERARACLEDVIDELAVRGCDAIGLCCTELPLVISDERSSLPLLDSTLLLAKAAVQQFAATEVDAAAA
jgi:aspartate racemase